MSDQQERFGELRSLLMGKQSTHYWNKICRLLDQWDEDDYFLDVVLPYAVDYLKQWPHDVRLAPQRWVKCAIAGEPTYRMQVASKLSCSGRNYSNNKLCTLFSQPGVTSIAEAVLDDNYASTPLAELLIHSEYTTNIKTLGLQRNRMSADDVRMIVQSDWFANIESFDIGDMLYKEGRELELIRGYLTAFDHPSCANLKRLNVSWTYIEADEFLTFVRSEHLLNLIELEMYGFSTEDTEKWPVVLKQLEHASMFSKLEEFTFYGHGLDEEVYDSLLIEGQFNEEIMSELAELRDEALYWEEYEAYDDEYE